MEKEDRPVEINDLNKTQLILLAILLSFVVSIATGIVTATLLQQAPPAVTQTINRVVQQTIEKVAPDYTPGKTQTVIVKEDDLVVDAVSKARANLYQVYETPDSKDSTFDAFSTGDGIFIVNAGSIDQSKSYIVKDGETPVTIKVLSVSYSNGLAVLGTDPSDKSAKDFSKPDFGKDADIKAGQTVIAVSENYIDKDTVQNVILKNLKDKDGNITDTWNIVSLGNSISASLVGAPVANLDGTIVGFVSSIQNADGTAKTQIIGIDAVNTMISSAPKTPPSPVSANVIQAATSETLP